MKIEKLENCRRKSFLIFLHDYENIYYIYDIICFYTIIKKFIIFTIL